MNEFIENIAGLIKNKYRQDILKYSESFILNSLKKRMTATNCISHDNYKNLFESEEGEAKKLIASFSINFSEFFRNSLTFAVLERVVIPSLLAKGNGRELRIWSCACAAGHEAYSIAIILEELKNKSGEQINYRIFATDKDESQIKFGIKGEFDLDALKNVSMHRIDNWFINNGNMFSIKSVLKEKIDFSVFDLNDNKLSSPSPSIFGEFDIVFCANILFYYCSEIRKNIIDKIQSTLADGGYFVTGETEREILMHQGYTEVSQNSAIFQK